MEIKGVNTGKVLNKRQVLLLFPLVQVQRLSQPHGLAKGEPILFKDSTCVIDVCFRGREWSFMSECDCLLSLVFSTFKAFKQFCKLGILNPGIKKRKPKKIRNFFAYSVHVQSSCSFFCLKFLKDAVFPAMGSKKPKSWKLCVLDRPFGLPLPPPPS